MEENKEVNPTKEKGKNKKVMFGLLGLVIICLICSIIISIGAAIFLLSGPQELSSDEEAKEVLEEAISNLQSYDGVVTFESSGEGLTIKLEVDFQNQVLSSNFLGITFYETQDKRYQLTDGNWSVASKESDFTSSVGLDLELEPKDEVEYIGLVDCPTDNDIQCYEIKVTNTSSIEDEFETSSNAGSYFIDANNKLILSVNNDLEDTTVEVEIFYQEGETLEIPAEALESAVDLEKVFDMNENIEFSGLEISINSVEEYDPQQEFAFVADDEKLISIDVTITNVSADALGFGNQFNFNVSDDEDEQYKTDFSSTFYSRKPELNSDDLEQGETIEGYVSFAIPIETNIDDLILFYSPTFTSTIKFDIKQ